MDIAQAQDPSNVEQLDRLRSALIEELHALDALLTKEVEAAIRTVPRHRFVPAGVTLEQAYAAERAEITKKDKHGVDISSVSAVRVQAMMLEQAGIRPGMNVLEIGSGGYNAALMAELVGGEGQVTSIDIDVDVIERARRLLDETGYGHVRTVLADGELGEPGNAPFDRIIVTVGAWDIPPAWVEQLGEAGRLVVPLRARGLTRSVVFERDGDHLTSRDYQLCGFVPMQGAGEHRVRLVVLHGEDVGLRLDDGQQADADALRDALTQPRAQAWSGVTIGGSTPFDDLDLWLATSLPDYALLAATRSARERGLVASASPLGISTLIDGGSFAYRTVRQVPGEEDLYEFGAYGHGPNAEKVARRLADQIRTWDREHRTDRASFQIFPVGTLDDRLPAGRVFDKRHTRLLISWPAPRH